VLEALSSILTGLLAALLILS